MNSVGLQVIPEFDSIDCNSSVWSLNVFPMVEMNVLEERKIVAIGLSVSASGSRNVKIQMTLYLAARFRPSLFLLLYSTIENESNCTFLG